MIADLRQLSLPGSSVYDELSADGVTPRPHWKPLIDWLHSIGTEELAHRWSRAERRIKENGVTYNIYTDPRGVSRSWEIDAIPLLIAPEEWRRIEAGIVQRAQLLNLVLADLYGPRRLVSQGDLPAALLFANPAFLRPLAGIPIPKRNYLHLLAVDLARSPDGQWWVLADRTQAPSGAGYALENRTIIAEVFPEQFREAKVQRLASFFQALRGALIGLSAASNPRIVLLTPGPYNETYFEHAYLARYLGLTLAEGADLTVRDRRVYLKTIDGLLPVDVILRRVDSNYCDPLELEGDSFLGIAGLVDAIRADNVRVANALGSGVIETAAIMPFLPGLARQLLGETLKLPSVATWWCGQDYARDWVLDHLHEVVIKPAFPLRGREPVFGADLASKEKEELAGRLRSRPYEYVAQEQIALSTAPIWDNGRLDSRSLVLRTYVLNTGNGWLAMPGGLARVSGADGPVVSMQRGGLSKDIWVLSDSPVNTFSLLRPRDQPVELRRGPADLPSRAADNLFWLGRYAERSEGIARLLRCIAPRLRQASGAELACLLRLHGCLVSKHSTLPKDKAAAAKDKSVAPADKPPAGPDLPTTAFDLEQEVISLVGDTERPDSLSSYLAEVHRIGGNVRERLSLDMIRLVGHLSDAAPGPDDSVPFVDIPALLNRCVELLTGFSGMERENITRGAGWLFLSLGRRLERAMFIVRYLRELVAPLDEESWPLLEYLLEVADSSMTYRSRYFTTLQPAPVLDVLMADDANPRSLAFQLNHLADLYGKLPRHVPADLLTAQKAADLIRGLNLQSGHLPLKRAIVDLANLLPSWSDNLTNTYFSHARTFAIRIGG
jgi:uncharacterized circularly permuted ATP-grasp superfamily protein/uncharacterized alpha-E superfamily protein